MDYQQSQSVQGRLRGVLIEVDSGLQSETIHIVDELIDHNECGVATEMLSEKLAESQSSISKIVFESIEQLVTEMKLGIENVDRLRPFVI